MGGHLQPFGGKFAFHELRDIFQIPGKFPLIPVLSITFQRVDDVNYGSWVTLWIFYHCNFQ